MRIREREREEMTFITCTVKVTFDIIRGIGEKEELLFFLL